jgi:hypothetical protein
VNVDRSRLIDHFRHLTGETRKRRPVKPRNERKIRDFKAFFRFFLEKSASVGVDEIGFPVRVSSVRGTRRGAGEWPSRDAGAQPVRPHMAGRGG